MHKSTIFKVVVALCLFLAGLGVGKLLSTAAPPYQDYFMETESPGSKILILRVYPDESQEKIWLTESEFLARYCTIRRVPNPPWKHSYPD